MHAKTSLLALIALAAPMIVSISATPARAEDKTLTIAHAKIRLNDYEPEEYENRSRVGLVYGGESTILAELAFYDAAGRDLNKSCPVVIRTRSVGITAIAAMEGDGSISLDRVDGKSPRQLLGRYYGLQVAVAALVGVGGTVAVNSKSHVVLRDIMAERPGLGVDLSVPKITVMPDTDPDRVRSFGACDWNRVLRTSKNYTGGDSENAEGSKSVPEQIAPGAVPSPAPAAAIGAQ